LEAGLLFDDCHYLNKMHVISDICKFYWNDVQRKLNLKVLIVECKL